MNNNFNSLVVSFSSSLEAPQTNGRRGAYPHHTPTIPPRITITSPLNSEQYEDQGLLSNTQRRTSHPSGIWEHNNPSNSYCSFFIFTIIHPIGCGNVVFNKFGPPFRQVENSIRTQYFILRE